MQPQGQVSSYQLEVTLWQHRTGATIPLQRAVLDGQAVKGIASASGSWNLTLGVRSLPISWDSIEDDDWLGIVLRDVASNTEHLLSWGLVDAARYRRRTDEQAKPIITCALHGRDFGKAFESSDLLYDSYLQNAAPLIPGIIDRARYQALVDAVQVNRQLKPAEAVRRTLAILTPGWWYLPKQLGGGQTLGDMLHVRSDVELGQVLNLGGYVPNGTQKLDPYLRRTFATPFHEWWYDLAPATAPVQAARAAAAPAFLSRFGLVPTVHFRNILSPFHDGTGAHTIAPWEELEVDLGTSGAERFTLFATSGPAWAASLTMGTWAQGGGRLPMFEHAADTLNPTPSRTFAGEIARHGLRVLDVSDQLAPTSRYGQEQKVPLEWILERTRQLFELYSVLPRCYSGTITVSRLRPEIRVGDRVVHRGRGYQVAQVQHGFQVGQNAAVVGQTMVAVTKGLPLGTKPPATPGPWMLASSQGAS